MKNQMIYTAFAMLVAIAAAVGLAADDRFSLKTLNGIAFSEFQGYESWPLLAPSQTGDGIKAILGNPVMVEAMKAGIPGNGRPTPDGAVMVKIEWLKVSNPKSPYSVTVPGELRSVSFMKKDSKRFPGTDGWGYAQFMYDAASRTFKPYGSNSSFVTICHQCHTAVQARDFVFTGFPAR